VRAVIFSAAFAVLAGLPSCQLLKPLPDPTHRHLLEAVAPRGAAMPGPHGALAVGRANLPGYLDRGAMVLRHEDGTLQPSRVALWGEPLDVAVARVTAGNLRALTGNPSILPGDDFQALDYSRVLEISVHRLDPDPDGQVVLEASWVLARVRGGAEDADPTLRSFRAAVPVAGYEPGARPSSAGVVGAMNECLARLAAEVARELRASPEEETDG